MLAQAQTFKRTMLEEKNRLERDVRMPPSPPLRAMQPVPVMPPPPSPAMASAMAVDGPGAAPAGSMADATDEADPSWAASDGSDPAAESASAPVGAAPAAAAAAGEAAMDSNGGPLLRAARHSMTSDEITKLLADLADLRDRGAISAEDYEAKKQDLLARL
jgi:hypothetical protein